MNEYEYVVKDGDTLQILSEAFYRDSKHHPYLAKYNNIKGETIPVNKKLKMPRILMASSETSVNTSTLHLVYRSSSAVKNEGEILQVQFQDSFGKETEVTEAGQNVILVVETNNLVGKTVNIDLSDAAFDYEYKGKILENDTLKDFKIESDTMKIELKSVREGK